MSLYTDDGFIIESHEDAVSNPGQGGNSRWIVLALDESEALGLLKSDMPKANHLIVASGDDVRAQAARLGVEPGTYQQI